jgi:hypothetical protein
VTSDEVPLAMDAGRSCTGTCPRACALGTRVRAHGCAVWTHKASRGAEPLACIHVPAGTGDTGKVPIVRGKNALYSLSISLSLSLSLHTRRRGVRHQQFVGGEQYYCYYYSLPPPLRTPVRCTYARRETRARKGCAGNYSSTPTLLRSAKAWCVCVCVCVCITC